MTGSRSIIDDLTSRIERLRWLVYALAFEVLITTIAVVGLATVVSKDRSNSIKSAQSETYQTICLLLDSLISDPSTLARYSAAIPGCFPQRVHLPSTTSPRANSTNTAPASTPPTGAAVGPRSSITTHERGPTQVVTRTVSPSTPASRPTGGSNTTPPTPPSPSPTPPAPIVSVCVLGRCLL